MSSSFKRALRKLLHAIGLTSLRAALLREARLRTKLRHAQMALASRSRLPVTKLDARQDLLAIIEAFERIEQELRGRLARAEHALEVERACKSPTAGQAEDGRPADSPDVWRDRFVASVLHSADPRALTGSAPMRLRPAQPGGLDTAELVDTWTPAPRTAVSIVVVTYNRLELLKLAVQSIREQAPTASNEIIVVDVGSTDGTSDWLIRQADIVSVVRHNREGNPGKSWGSFLNLGLRLAQGKWVCMVSDHSLLLPSAVAKGLQHVETLETEGRNIGAAAFYFRYWPKMERYFVQHTLGGMLMVTHGFFLKEALIDVGYASEDLYSLYKADTDLSLKLWEAGYEIVDCPESFLEHLQLPSDEPRLHSNNRFDRDQHLLLERWAGRFTSADIPEAFKRPYQRFSEFRDKSDTARRFEPFIKAAEAGQS